MINNWDDAISKVEKYSNEGGLFVKLANNGDTVVGAFVGEPCARDMHWVGDRNEECPGEGCEHCAQGKKPSMRVSFNFFVPADISMKIIEGGVTWFKDVVKVRDKYGLESKLFEIERHGDPGSTKTTYSILPGAMPNASIWLVMI